MPEGMESKELFTALSRSYSRYILMSAVTAIIPFLKAPETIILKKRREIRPYSKIVVNLPIRKVYSLACRLDKTKKLINALKATI